MNAWTAYSTIHPKSWKYLVDILYKSKHWNKHERWSGCRAWDVLLYYQWSVQLQISVREMFWRLIFILNMFLQGIVILRSPTFYLQEMNKWANSHIPTHFYLFCSVLGSYSISIFLQTSRGCFEKLLWWKKSETFHFKS